MMEHVIESDANADIDEFLGQPADAVRGRKHRWIIAAAALLGVIVVVLFWLFGGSAGPRYATGEVTRGDINVYVNATGTLQPTNEVSVGSELSGLIKSIYVDVNDKVVRGQPLAQIDKDKLNDQIRRSEASLQQARATVLQAQAAIRQSKAALGRLEEVRRISGGKVPSEADLETAQAKYQSDLASLASANASVVAAQAQLATDQTNLGRATIRSPVNGVILSREIEQGQTVAASFNTPTLFIIAEDLTQMKLEVKVDEADVGQVKAAQHATFTVDAYPGKTFDARIMRVNVGANNARSSSGTSGSSSSSSTVVSYGALLSVNNPDLALRPGMTANATILTSRKHDVRMVPNAALRFTPSTTDDKAGGGFGFFSPRPGGDGEAQQVEIGRGSKQSVYVLQPNGSLARVDVQIGDTNGEQTIITSGQLKAGVKVATGELAQEQ